MILNKEGRNNQIPYFSRLKKNPDGCKKKKRKKKELILQTITSAYVLPKNDFCRSSSP